MTVTSAVVGAVTPTSAVVVAKVVGSTARLVVADNPALTSPSLFEVTVPDSNGMVRLRAEALEPDTAYHWGIQVDSTLDPAVAGRLRTHPAVGDPASFRFGTSHCAGSTNAQHIHSFRVSNAPVFDIIRQRAVEEDWLFFAHLGDLHYRDIAVNDPSLFRDAYDAVLAAPRQHQLYQQVPWVYMYDDHDFGPNNSDATGAWRNAANQVYRERVPHMPLGGVDVGVDDHLAQAWQVGRIQFVLLDVRSFRDPNNAPDGPDKTMLGAVQKAWLAEVLATSDAEALVVFSPSLWHEEREDSWGSFPHEREELVDLFGEHGWLDRMVMYVGDRHAIGIDDGSNNPYGGFPIGLFGSLDSAGPTQQIPLTGSTGRLYSAGLFQGSDQWGSVEVVDTGDELRIVSSGWQGSTLWGQHTLTIHAAPVDPPPPPPAGPAPSAARIRTSVTWFGVDAVTGKVIAELPDLTGTITRGIGSHESAGITLPIPLAGPAAIGPAALQATEPRRTMVVAVVNDVPAWGGLVVARSGGTHAVLQLSCVTPEGYLDRRTVRNHDLRQVDQATIMAILASDAEDIDGIGRGLDLLIDAEQTGILRDRVYRAADRTSVYQRMQELSRVIGGPEWTIDLEWGDLDHTVVRKVLRIRQHLGVAATEPTTVFETTAHSVFSSQGTSDATYEYTEDWSDGRGANWVEAFSSGEGDDQPASAPAINVDDLAAGAPIFERHFQPGSNITSQAVLDDHAAAELERLRSGTGTWKIVARWNAYPRYGVDWRLGDDVAWRLVGHRHPAGVTGRGRVIGWELDLASGLMAPVVLGDHVVEERLRAVTAGAASGLYSSIYSKEY